MDGQSPILITADWIIVRSNAGRDLKSIRAERGLRHSPSVDKHGRVIPGEYVAQTGSVFGGGLPNGGPVAANIENKRLASKSKFEY